MNPHFPFSGAGAVCAGPMVPGPSIGGVTGLAQQATAPVAVPELERIASQFANLNERLTRAASRMEGLGNRVFGDGKAAEINKAAATRPGQLGALYEHLTTGHALASYIEEQLARLEQL